MLQYSAKHSVFSDVENLSPSNLHGFEKMTHKLAVVFLSDSFIIPAVYFAEFNFESALVQTAKSILSNQ